MSEQNQLAQEQSPYLQQHADNPVDWYPWCEEAFEKARNEDKPIFLSIGYSTCHWCHVMAHESFEDPEVAELLNDTFVNIKVDREERPDIDHTYMMACQILTGGGGWPLTILMTPDKKPFYAGTYIPRNSRFGRPGLLDFIPRIKQLWQNEREKIYNSADEISGALSKMSELEPADQSLDESILHTGFRELKKRFDAENGGFGDHPKFPAPHNLMFLLRYWKRTGNDEALQMVNTTLDNMRRGGIYDHIGFGFHRYSTDQQWLVPHFEKMLYDQAMLMLAYTEGYQVTDKVLYKKTVDEIITYVSRDMKNENGGFYSAEDADSEGEEGKFYIWSTGEIREVLPEEKADMVIDIYNLSDEGNYKDEASGQRTGKNIFHYNQSLYQLAVDREMKTRDLKEKLEKSRKKLFDAREKRVRPLRDDKILTDWNGLMIAALSKAGRVFDNDRYTEMAREAAEFILTNMYEGYSQLKHRYRNGETDIDAHSDDYAFLIWGLIELYESTFEEKYLQKALELQEEFDQHFWDSDNGGYFHTGDFGEELLGRQKPSYDGALPSANSVSALNLLRLGRITADTDLEEKADDVGRLFAPQVEEAPTGYTQLLQAIDFGVGPVFEVVIVGYRNSDDTEKMRHTLYQTYTPRKVVVLKPIGESETIETLAPYTTGQTARADQATAYVCENYECKLPTTDLEEMSSLLELE